jgi:hypothetical protein
MLGAYYGLSWGMSTHIVSKMEVYCNTPQLPNYRIAGLPNFRIKTKNEFTGIDRIDRIKLNWRIFELSNYRILEWRMNVKGDFTAEALPAGFGIEPRHQPRIVDHRETEETEREDFFLFREIPKKEKLLQPFGYLHSAGLLQLRQNCSCAG